MFGVRFPWCDVRFYFVCGSGSLNVASFGRVLMYTVHCSG